MKLGPAATKLYDTLSTVEVHGGTGDRFFAYATTPSQFVCSFVMRPPPKAAELNNRMWLFAAGHKIACGEVLALCADYAEPTEKLGNAAAAFQVLASSITGDLSPELASRITDLLRQFGVDEVTSYTLE